MLELAEHSTLQHLACATAIHLPLPTHPSLTAVQRQSFWDAFFIILSRRENDWLGLLLRLLVQVRRGCWLCWL